MNPATELDSLIQAEVQRIQTANEASGLGPGRIDCHTGVHRMLNSKANRDLIRRVLGTPERLRQWIEEPHLRYNLLRRVESPLVMVPVEQGDAFMRLAMGAPEKAYEHTPAATQCLFSDVHLGQRKLLINEILFLTQHGSKSNVVVYIGAAGGQHIPILGEMFPRHRFLLYDPAQFSRPLMEYMRKNPQKIKVYNELFPPAPGSLSAKELEEATGGETGFLLISDIRRRDESSDAPTNKDVDEDMELQVDICRKMNPKAAHLKCRLPYLDPEANPPEPDVEVKVPNGEIYFQPWCPHKSTETRLVIEPPYTDDNSRPISARWYESALYYHNSVSRYHRYSVAVLAPLEVFVGTIYDSCFDCTFERYTIWLYLTSSHKAESYSNLSVIFNLIKRTLGREDDRLLR